MYDQTILTAVVPDTAGVVHGTLNALPDSGFQVLDIYEGVAVILAAALVWAFGAGWPDLVIAAALLVLFLRSAVRVLRAAWRESRPSAQPSATI